MCVGFVSGGVWVGRKGATGLASIRTFEKLSQLQVEPASGQG